MANFTPQEIEEMLQEFFSTVGKRQYTGARYVPIFGRRGSNTCDWDNSDAYEPLTIVIYQGNSYTSKQYVPKDIDITDTNYWVQTGNWNAQIEQYRQEVLQFQDEIDTKIPWPIEPESKYGNAGQVLGTLLNGLTKWVDPVTVTSEIAAPLIEAWLDDHPEATTTVEDGSITDPKISPLSTLMLTKQASSVTKLSDIVDAGIYYLNDTFLANITDLPNTGINYAVLINFEWNPNKPLQFLVKTGQPFAIWYRLVAASVSAWQQITPLQSNIINDENINQDSTLIFTKTAPNVTKISDIKDAGVYYLNNTFLANVTDLPETGITYAVLINYEWYTNRPIQILIKTNTPFGMWFRIIANTISPWMQIYPANNITDSSISDSSTILMKRTTPSLTKLSDLRQAGIYYFVNTDLANIIDLPDYQITYAILINAIWSGNYPLQILFTTGGASPYKVFWRFVGAGGAREWNDLTIANTSDILYGKKLVTAGDSYTAALFGQSNPKTGKNYGYYVAKRHNMTFVNSGISGSIMGLDKTYVEDPTQVDINLRDPFSYQRYLQIPSDTDYLTIWFGINDTLHVNLGTINDTTNETFYGAWNVVLKYYLENRPFMHVGIICYSHNASYSNAIKEVAEKWGYPVWDLQSDQRIPAFFERTGISTEADNIRKNNFGWNTWNAHPNPEWHEFISSNFEEFLRSL